MKSKTSLLNLTAILICLLGLSVTATAQKRRATTRKSSRPAATTTAETTASKSAAANAEFRAASEKVSAQIKNVTRFIYLLGSIAQGIEDVDKAVKAGNASRTTADQNAKNKQDVVATIRNLRAGLAALEGDFQASPTLRLYIFHIQGIADVSAVAEQQASNGQLKESGKTLLEVINKLSDTLAAIP